jgi:exodeoxyribonuclease V alpha subunit
MKIDNFSVDQHTAVELCLDLSARIVSVTGEAGTGKSSVLGVVVTELHEKGYSVAVCAPTGRAAQRIRELTGHRAQTAHRLLGYGAPDPDDPDDITIPKRSRIQPIPADVVIVDEASMLSEDLHRNLVDALRPGASIRFFGDIHQLPPVKSEGVPPFKKMLDKYPKVILTKNFRSTDGIVQAAQSVLRGLVPRTNSKFQLLNYTSSIGLNILDKFIDQDFMTPRAQIIAPTRTGKLGTQIINGYIQQKLNLNKRVLDLEYDLGRGEMHKLRVRQQDKVLWTKNDYNLGLMNGMIGTVVDFDDFTGAVVITFDGKDYTIPSLLERFDDNNRKVESYDPRKYIDLAYAITTHKSQGSEFARVVMMLYWSSVMSRENFYTAITRGKEHVTIIAGPGGLKAAMAPDPIFKEKK